MTTDLLANDAPPGRPSVQTGPPTETTPMTPHRLPPLSLTSKTARRDGPPVSPHEPEWREVDDICRLVAVESVARRAGGRPAARLRRYVFRMTVDASFSIEDMRVPTLDIPRGEKEQLELFSASPSHCLVWAPDGARASLVVELRDTPPGVEDLDEWDHVAEVGLALPSGRLQVGADPVEDLPAIHVHPGPHRARLCIGNLDRASERDGRPAGGSAATACRSGLAISRAASS